MTSDLEVSSSPLSDAGAVVRLENRRAGVHVEVGGGPVTLMGVINRSPESANKDVYADTPAAAVALASRYALSGVTVIDVGGQSTNYENPQVTVAEELDRLIPTVEALVDAGVVVSADTFRAEVAAAAVDAGAGLINDTAGLGDADMRAVVGEKGVPVVLMYLEGQVPLEVDAYDDGVDKHLRMAEVIRTRLDELTMAGVDQAIVDPGTGISYRSDYDRYSQSQFEIAENLQPLVALGAPVLYAVPRKADRYRNVALAALAMASGASMLRIHDVEAIGDVAWLMRHIPNKPSGGGA